MNQPIKGYIFDMDGTPVDNCAYHVASWQKFSKAHGKTLTYCNKVRRHRERFDEATRER